MTLMRINSDKTVIRSGFTDYGCNTLCDITTNSSNQKRLHVRTNMSAK